MVRAAWYRETRPAEQVLQVGDLPDDLIGAPAAGEVAVRVHASGVNPADVKRRAGWGGTAMQHDLVVPHADGAGVIEAVGEGASPELIGQRVWIRNGQGGYGEAGRAFGTAAERIVLPAAQVFPLHDSLDFAAGACLGIPALTAFHAVFADGSVAGKTVLVTGAAGAVAHFAVQFALADGARVIATVSSAAKAAQVAALGVDDIIDRHQEDVAARILECTGGQGVDRVVEVDFGANLEVTRQVMKPGAVVAAYSSTAVPRPVLPYYDFAFRGATLRFIQGYLLRPQVVAAAVALIDDLADRGTLRIAVAKRLPLDQIAQAHQMVETGAALGNVVVEIR